MKIRAHVVVTGYVQGVFFRESTSRLARSLNITGWMRNRDDGAVEAVFEGDESNVHEIVEFCRHGPPRAKVTNTNIDWETYMGDFDGFEIRF